MSGPLSGLRIVDASNFVFGPVATQMLGDMGAEVIKIEPPEGDPTRKIGKSRNQLMGTFFLNLNRNKQSVVLDLKRPEAAAALQRLLGTADVFVHNMRSTAEKKLGLDYETVGTRFPRLVHASAQGFAAGGRYFDRPAYDDVIQGLSGISGLNQRMTGEAAYAPMLLTDKLCGVFLSNAISMALLHRERSGRGQSVKVPMFESMVAFNLLEHLADGVLAPASQDGNCEPRESLGYARVFGTFHRPLPTRNGFICVIANTDAQWARLFDVIGRAELVADPRFSSIGSRMKHVDELYGVLELQLRGRATSDWLCRFEAADVPAGPANDLAAVREDPHLNERDFFRKFEHDSEGSLWMTDIATSFSDSPGAIRRGPPRLGQHTTEILASLGYGTAELERLVGSTAPNSLQAD